jgi:IS4 transposase
MIEEITEHGVTFNRATTDEDQTLWRLVHDGVRVRMLEEVTGTTDSIHQINDFESQEAALSHITDSGLEYEPEEEEPS